MWSGPVLWLPPHRVLVVLWLSSFLILWVALFYLAGLLVFLVFFEFASSSGYSSKRALLHDRVDSSGRPPSESSQSSRSLGRAVSWVYCMIVVVPPLLPPTALAF